VLQKGVTATVVLTLRSSPGSTGRAPTIPLETAADNKEMGRVLIRRGGETIAAGEPFLADAFPIGLMSEQES
jgi:elongation factor 1 alpha-like protein